MLCKGVYKWMNCIGRPAVEVRDWIKERHPELNVIFHDATAPFTEDLRRNRVRIFYNAEDKVVRDPKNA